MQNTRKPEVTRNIELLPLPRNTTRTIDDRQTTSDQHAVHWSGPTAALFGYRIEDIENTGSWWLSRIHPDDRLRISSELRDHLAPVSGNPYDSESRIWGCDYRFKHAQGHYFTVADRSIVTRDDAGNVMTVTSILSDKEKRSVERKEYEELHNSQNHLAVIADNTPSGIFMMDPQGYTTYMNTAGKSGPFTSHSAGLYSSSSSRTNHWLYL